jgi:hypothetical protein
MSSRLVLRLLLLGAVTATVALDAQAGPPGSAELPAFTPEREAAAMQFVGRHHPELAGVLTALKSSKSDEYEQAVRELSQIADRLALIRPSDEALYNLMLQAWINNSNAELLAARIACAAEHPPALDEELKRLLSRQVDLQIQIVEHNRQKTLTALEAMDSSIRSLQDSREQMIERRFRMLTRAAKPAATGKPTADKPAAANVPGAAGAGDGTKDDKRTK